jgi:hypothetical protein
MRHTARPTRDNRTITVDFRDDATYYQLLGDDKAFVECGLAFLLSLGFQLTHKHASARAGACLRWASACATLPTMSPPQLGQPTANAGGAGLRTRRRAGMPGSVA